MKWKRMKWTTMNLFYCCLNNRRWKRNECNQCNYFLSSSTFDNCCLFRTVGSLGWSMRGSTRLSRCWMTFRKILIFMVLLRHVFRLRRVLRKLTLTLLGMRRAFGGTRLVWVGFLMVITVLIYFTKWPGSGLFRVVFNCFEMGIGTLRTRLNWVLIMLLIIHPSIVLTNLVFGRT